ncbi:hypothetical protein JF710_16655 [Mycobacterium intracellulare]|uniref:hypothetical protein n=1 Tax=Mycobacterium intracellulare TaxID=1767 RepID=UPI001CDAEEF0|nr:hypothetical protein [Mycobacterium intracellulare]MCA2254812.1 hypothetical protein [Mycobacterium intracellulare]
MSTVFGYLLHHGTAILGVLGFVISVYNLVSAIRNRTVNPQPQLLAELRGYLDFTLQQCQQVKHRLNFDRYSLHIGQLPDIPTRPIELDTAIEKMPELGFTITSVGQRQIELLHMLIRDVAYNWDTVKSCLGTDNPANTSVLEFSEKLRRRCLIVEKFFPVYVETVTAINKGNIWKRYKYRDHRSFTYKVFRWTPLSHAVNDYDRALRGE